MNTLTELIEAHGIDVLEHLDREAEVPVHTGLQRQGDLIIVPLDKPTAAESPVPKGGAPVVEGGLGGNAHVLLGEGPVTFDPADPKDPETFVGVLTVAEGAIAWLAHPEHAYTGIGPGTYEIRRQREQWDRSRAVAD